MCFQVQTVHFISSSYLELGSCGRVKEWCGSGWVLMYGVTSNLGYMTVYLCRMYKEFVGRKRLWRFDILYVLLVLRTELLMIWGMLLGRKLNVNRNNMDTEPNKHCTNIHSLIKCSVFFFLFDVAIQFLFHIIYGQMPGVPVLSSENMLRIAQTSKRSTDVSVCCEIRLHIYFRPPNENIIPKFHKRFTSNIPHNK